jgi:hypothetical protein
MNLSDLLDACSNPQSPLHKQGWQQFIERYLPHIERKIAVFCKRWHLARLDMQFSESVNDVRAKVFEILCQNEFKALRDFKYRHNEYRFLSYLSAICHNATSHYVKSYLNRIATLEPEEAHSFADELAADTRQELFEYIVQALIDSRKKHPKNFERDLNLYLLYVWGDFSKDAIADMPIYRGIITPKMVDLAVHRLRSVLRNISEN